MSTPELKKYIAHVRTRNGLLPEEYVDWFTDDDDARKTYRVIMEEQGYEVRSVTVNDGKAIVEIG